MDTNEFDKAVVGAVFARAALVGWDDTSLVEAARDAGLDLGQVRVRFPGKGAVLLRFGVIADQMALAALPAAPTGLPREKLFDLVMGRLDALQAHRAGVLALMEALRRRPGASLMLYGATLRSMRWLLEAAGIPASGVVGQLRVHGMGAVWAYVLRAWVQDESADMAATMAALDRALDRAVQAEGSLPWRARADMSQAAAMPDMPDAVDAGMNPESGGAPLKVPPTEPPPVVDPSVL